MKWAPFIYRADDLRIDWLGQDSATGRDVIDQLGKRSSLDFFSFKVGYRVEKIEAQAALAQFTNEELLLLAGRNICKNKKISKINEDYINWKLEKMKN